VGTQDSCDFAEHRRLGFVRQVMKEQARQGHIDTCRGDGELLGVGSAEIEAEVSLSWFPGGLR
jgi:hypothetical protein